VETRGAINVENHKRGGSVYCEKLKNSMRRVSGEGLRVETDREEDMANKPEKKGFQTKCRSLCSYRGKFPGKITGKTT
jgi:hypothetical protein